MKFGLEFMAIVCSDCVDAEGKFINDVVDKIDSIFLSMMCVDFKGPYADGVVHNCILKTLHFLPIWPIEFEKFHIYLDMLPRHWPH